MLKNAIWLFFISIAVFLLFLPSYAKMQDLKLKNALYERQITELEKMRTDLLEEKRLLEDDPEYLEKIAREKMGLIKQNEVIYKITTAQETK